MKSYNAIEVGGVSKKFCRSLKRSLAYGALDVMKSAIGMPPMVRLRHGEFWALNNVSFELAQGETLGVLGANGSGKSTLLRLISGIFPPSEGNIGVRGRLGSMIALGAGFHPHMTGLENIFLNATILGMSGREIRQKLEEIVEFSELGSFIDAPVATYSSGMTIRLGFAVAIHSDLDVILIDEVLSVGDVSFQNKCFRKILDKKKDGVSFVFVSHSLNAVRAICDRGMVLDRGKVELVGSVEEAVRRYSYCEGKPTTNGYLVQSDCVELLDLGLIDDQGDRVNSASQGENLRIRWDFVPNRPLRDVSIGIGITDGKSSNILYAFTENFLNVRVPDMAGGQRCRAEIVFEKPNLRPGQYGFNCVICNKNTDEIYLQTYSTNETGFQVVPLAGRPQSGGILDLATEWSLRQLAR